ncbi:hypothetical protein [Chitinophaga vietnamensis]|uniref:hypothetical protein n=1 Tax=Chitinophaga vietnamensis TaxID=2593957 RepID=UPI0011773B69|nr:hypothetical protein [Chitinophaga vietnamensis]
MKQSITKIGVALVQLRASIGLYNKGDYISSITLGGVAEEILGQIAKNQTNRNSLIDEKYFFDQLAQYFKRPQPSIGRVQRRRNRIKNELKHNDSGENNNITHDFQSEAEDFIIGAINNYQLITGHLPTDRRIKNFWTHMQL